MSYVSKVTGSDAAALGDAARACEELEALVKFVPRMEGEGPEADVVRAAMRSWVAAAGIMIWSR